MASQFIKLPVAPAASGSGTVTSVGVSAPSIFNVAGSPVTTTGTIAITLANEAANLIFAGPTSGGAAAPTFRGLVFADTPVTPASTTLWVDATRVDTYTADGSLDRPYKTVQAAVNRIISNADNTSANPYNILINRAESGATVDLTNTAVVYVNFMGFAGLDHDAISLTSVNITNASFFKGTFSNVTIGTMTAVAPAVDELNFWNCRITGTTNITLSLSGQTFFYGVQAGALNLTNVGFAFWDGGQGPGATTLVNASLVFQGSSIAGAVNIDSSSGLYLRNGVRIATSAVTLNGILQAYGSYLGGTITIGATGNLLNRGSFIKESNVVNVSGGTYTQDTVADMIGYTAAVPGSWPTPPTQVKQALDELAAVTLASESANLVFAGPTSGSASPTFRSLTLADIPSVSPSFSQIVYVAVQGNDTTGNGTFAKPYATPKKAMDSLTDNAYAKPYIISVGPGVYTDGVNPIILKPFVYIVGAGRNATIINYSAGMTLHSSFSTVAQARFGISNFNMGTGDIALDFQAVGGTPTAAIFEIVNVFIRNVTLSSRDTVADNLFMQDVTMLTLTQHGGYAEAWSSSFEYVGDVTGSTTTGVSTGFTSCILLTATMTGGASPAYFVSTGGYTGTLAVSGSAAQVYTDAISTPGKGLLTLTGGAVLINSTDATDVAFTPATPGNWPTTITNVDEALNSLGATTSGLLVFTSTATVGGAAAEAVTVTGILATDTILAVSQKVKGAANLPLLAFDTLVNNGITLRWVADPGVGAIVIVSVKR